MYSFLHFIDSSMECFCFIVLISSRCMHLQERERENTSPNREWSYYIPFSSISLSCLNVGHAYTHVRASFKLLGPGFKPWSAVCDPALLTSKLIRWTICLPYFPPATFLNHRLCVRIVVLGLRRNLSYTSNLLSQSLLNQITDLLIT